MPTILRTTSAISLLLGLSAACVAPSAYSSAEPSPAHVEYHAVDTRAFFADESTTFDALLATLRELGYEVREQDRRRGRVIALSPVETTFQDLVGERAKATRVTFIVDEMFTRSSIRRVRTLVRVKPVLMEGPADGELAEQGPVSDALWFDDVFEHLREELAARTVPPAQP